LASNIYSYPLCYVNANPAVSLAVQRWTFPDSLKFRQVRPALKAQLGINFA
jgi:hypothetical protein